MTTSPCATLLPSSKRNSSLIVVRTKHGDCHISDQLLFCHYGNTHNLSESLKQGEAATGRLIDRYRTCPRHESLLVDRLNVAGDMALREGRQ